MKKIISLSIMLISFSSMASYENCTISNGQVTSCTTWSQSNSHPVLNSDGYYYDCSISNGNTTSCRSWYQGSAVIKQGDSYKSCSIANGTVISCGSWYQGNAIVDR